MSQRGPASRPASPPPSRSPSSIHHISPTVHRSTSRSRGDPTSEDELQEGDGVPDAHQERLQQGQRSLGVRNILNPATAPGPSSSAQPFVGQRSPAEPLGTQYGTSPSIQRPLLFRGHANHLLQETQRSSGEPLLPAGATTSTTTHASPGTTHSLSTSGGPRHYLTPRSPRASSLNHGVPPRVFHTQQPQYSGPNVPNSSRASLLSGSSADRPSNVYSDHSLVPHLGTAVLPGISRSGSLPSLNTSRSMSQPMLGHLKSPTLENSPQQQGASERPQGQAGFPPSLQYPMSAGPVAQGFPASSPGDGRWTPVHEAQHRVRNSRMPEEQPTIMFATPGGEHIEVAIERNTASRQADEKRLRNAGASARFRQRKKEKDQHKDSAIERLQAQNRELERRLRDAESELERYRTDRDRLRDVVHRTPSISNLAFQGTRSPPLRGAASFSRRTAHEAVPLPRPLPDPTYSAGDPVTGERPSRRRRTDPQLDYSPASYAATLPPPSFNTPASQAGTPSAGTGSERLPPLRLEQLHSTQMATHLPPNNPPSQGFPTAKRESYESGWAIQPGGPRPDLGQR